MNGHLVQDQKAIEREILVQEAVHGHSDIPAGATEKNTTSTVIGPQDYALDSVAENACYEPTDTLPLAMTRVDAAKLIQTWQQLEGIAKRQTPRIAIKAKGKVLLLDVAEIVAVEAEGNYISLRHRTNSYLLRESLSSIAEKLKPYGFMRIHRSVIVNTSMVEEIQPLPTGEYRLRVKGGKEYLLTRTYKHNLRNLAQLWIGSEPLCDEYPSR